MGAPEFAGFSYRLTTVYADAVGRLFSSKTDFSSNGTAGFGSAFASLHAFSQLRHPTHSVRSTSIPYRSGQPERSFEAKAFEVPPTRTVPPATASVARNSLRFTVFVIECPPAPVLLVALGLRLVGVAHFGAPLRILPHAPDLLVAPEARAMVGGLERRLSRIAGLDGGRMTVAARPDLPDVRGPLEGGGVDLVAFGARVHREAPVLVVAVVAAARLALVHFVVED